jgi:hypothetical protein
MPGMGRLCEWQGQAASPLARDCGAESRADRKKTGGVGDPEELGVGRLGASKQPGMPSSKATQTTRDANLIVDRGNRKPMGVVGESRREGRTERVVSDPESRVFQRSAPFPCHRVQQVCHPGRQCLLSSHLIPGKVFFHLDLTHCTDTLLQRSQKPLMGLLASCADIGLLYSFFTLPVQPAPGHLPSHLLTSPSAHQGARGQAG